MIALSLIAIYIVLRPAEISDNTPGTHNPKIWDAVIFLLAAATAFITLGVGKKDGSVELVANLIPGILYLGAALIALFRIKSPPRTGETKKNPSYVLFLLAILATVTLVAVLVTVFTLS